MEAFASTTNSGDGCDISSTCLNDNANTRNASTTKKLILSINAANGPMNWNHVEQRSSNNWKVEELVLQGFGETMRHFGFQAALDAATPTLERVIQELQPDVLLVSSKGLNIATFLALKGLWRGPLVMLSPIPNPCDHIEDGTSDDGGDPWGTQWLSSLKVLKAWSDGPIVTGAGTSSDEEMFVRQAMEDTGVCGGIGSNGVFETCPSWYLESFPGRHSWKNEERNAGNVAKLIDRIFAELDR